MRNLILAILFLLFNFLALGQITPGTPLGSQNDGFPLTTGARFVPKSDGSVIGAMVYRGATWAGSTTVHLWAPNGALMATATGALSGTGWRQINFPTAQPITAGLEYVVSYSNPGGEYVVSPNIMPLSGPLFDVPGARYTYAANTYPADSYEQSGYFVEPVLTANLAVKTDTIYSVIRDSITIQDTSLVGYWRAYTDSLTALLSVKPERDTITVDRSELFTDSAMNVWPFQGIWNYEFTIGNKKYRFIRAFVWRREELIGDQWVSHD